MDNSYNTRCERPFFIENYEELGHYYEKLYDTKISLKNKRKLDEKTLVVQFDKEMNDIFFEALRHYVNINCVVFYGYSKKRVFEKYKKYFSKEYYLYGIKELVFKNNNQKNSFIYQLYSNEILNQSDFKNFRNYYEDKDKVNILILMSPKKENIKFNEYLKKKKQVYFCDSLTKKFVLISIIFNENSLNMMEKQNIDFIIERIDSISFNYFKQYRKWLFLKIDLRDHHLFMLFSSIVLFIYCLREINDLDLYISDINNSYTNNISNTINDAFILKNGKFDYIDASIKGTSKWKCYWDEWLLEWADLCGAYSYDQIVINSQYHFYFCGVKMINLDCDIIRRVKRNRPNSIVDLYMLNKKLDLNIRIPEFPKFREKYFDLDKLNSVQKLNLLKKENTFITKDKKQIQMRLKNDMSIFLKIIQKRLRDRYNITCDIYELKKELNY